MTLPSPTPAEVRAFLARLGVSGGYQFDKLARSRGIALGLTVRSLDRALAGTIAIDGAKWHRIQLLFDQSARDALPVAVLERFPDAGKMMANT